MDTGRSVTGQKHEQCRCLSGENGARCCCTTDARAKRREGHGGDLVPVQTALAGGHTASHVHAAVSHVHRTTTASKHSTA